MKIMFEKHSQLSIDFDNHDFIEDRQKKKCALNIFAVIMCVGPTTTRDESVNSVTWHLMW